jgi:hypothetical protein
MAVLIEVAKPSYDRETAFSDLHLFHAGCTRGALRAHRNPAMNLYSLLCGCGLAIELAPDGIAQREIQLTAINGELRELPKGSFSSNVAGEIAVGLRDVA